MSGAITLLLIYAFMAWIGETSRLLYMQVKSQLIAQWALMLLHVSAANRSNFQEATSVEDTLSVLHTLSDINGETFLHAVGY